MNYSKRFKKRVKRAFGDDSSIQQSLEKDDLLIGHLLQQNMQISFSIDDILNANSLEELQSLAKKENEKKLVFEEWKKIYQKNSHK